MGVNYNIAKYLKRCKDNGCDYSRTVTLGHQEFYISSKKRIQLAKEVPEYTRSLEQKYSDEMLSILGAGEVDVLDISDYEGANIIHDMNEPIPEKYCGKYSCVFDGGATEHMFNYPVAITNIMKILNVGGCYIGTVPSDHVNGHGLYQFGPMIYIQLFCEQNGFKLEDLAFSKNPDSGELYVIKEPTSHHRIEVNSDHPMMIYVFAKKIREVDGEIKLYEGYYQDMWEKEETSPQTSRYNNIPNYIMKPARELKGMIARGKQKKDERNAINHFCERIMM